MGDGTLGGVALVLPLLAPVIIEHNDLGALRAQIRDSVCDKFLLAGVKAPAQVGGKPDLDALHRDNGLPGITGHRHMG